MIFFEKRTGKKKGNVVVLSGNNQKKAIKTGKVNFLIIKKTRAKVKDK